MHQQGVSRTQAGDTTMFTVSRLSALGVASLSLFSCLPAHAQNIEVRSGIFCDTQEHVERFVAVFDGNAEAAINAVNIQEKNAGACVGGTIAFIRGPEIATARTWNMTFRIFQVTVVGVLTEAGLRSAGPAATYSIESAEERTA
jgi:hypothetical protein